MIKIISYIVLTIFSITFSYSQIQTEEVMINNQAYQLPGTLTFLEGKTPLIIWVHGSGGVNRDGNQPQYIKQFREEINKKKISFFSYDKRTANPKNATFLKEDGVLIKDFVTDVVEVVNHFKNDNRFSEIILIGHSQGSLIAMLAAENTAKYISIAGAGETIDKTLIRQLTNQSAAIGKLTQSYFKELKETGEIKNIDPNLASIFSKPNQPFWKSWMELDPTKEIKNINVPILILNGDKDIQVPIVDAEKLKKANSSAKLVVIKNMNHILKDIQKEEDNLLSYSNPNFIISEQLIQTIVEFVKK